MISRSQSVSGVQIYMVTGDTLWLKAQPNNKCVRKNSLKGGLEKRMIHLSRLIRERVILYELCSEAGTQQRDGKRLWAGVSAKGHRMFMELWLTKTCEGNSLCTVCACFSRRLNLNYTYIFLFIFFFGIFHLKVTNYRCTTTLEWWVCSGMEFHRLIWLVPDWVEHF